MAVIRHDMSDRDRGLTNSVSGTLLADVSPLGREIVAMRSTGAGHSLTTSSAVLLAVLWGR